MSNNAEIINEFAVSMAAWQWLGSQQQNTLMHLVFVWSFNLHDKMTTKDAKEYMNRLEIPQLFEVRFLQKYISMFSAIFSSRYLCI